MDERQAFKAGFMLKCASLGMSPGEMKVFADSIATSVKEAGTLGDAMRIFIPRALDWGIMVPAAAGAGGGYLLAKALDADDTDIAAIRRRELAQEYLRQARRLRQGASKQSPVEVSSV